MLICKTCGKKLTKKQKVYCSRNCQHIGYSAEKVERKILKCPRCGKEFKILPSRIALANNHYCSRECKDAHQMELYVGENNPVYGTTHDESWRKNMSEITKKLWKSPAHRRKVANGWKRFIEKNGHSPGWDDVTIEKRKEAPHNWSDPKCRKKCEDTCIERYGMKSWEIAREKLHHTRETKPEKIFKELLETMGIEYIQHFKIDFCETYREYDFFLPQHNLLVEIDGDYWHGNRKMFHQLNEIQLRNVENDGIKNALAINMGYELIRIWESELATNSLDGFYEKIQG